MISEDNAVKQKYTNDEKKLLGRFNKGFLRTYNHENLSSVNLNSHFEVDYFEPLSLQEKLSKFFTPFPLKSTLPLPVLDPQCIPSSVVEGNDPANYVVSEKKKCYRELVTYFGCASRHTKLLKSGALHFKQKMKVMKDKAKNFEKSFSVSVPASVFKVASILDKIPERDFNGGYNWYYTGGNVETVKLDGRTLLFTAYGSNCDKLYAVPLKRSSTAPSGYRVKSTHSKMENIVDDNCIFQISAAEHGDIAVIGVRSKNTCTVYTCNDNPSTSLREIQQMSDNEVVFTSIAVSPWLGSDVITADRNSCLHLWDLHSRTSKSIRNIYMEEKYRHDWIGVHYSYVSHDTIFYSNAEEFKSLDLRAKNESLSSSLLTIKQLEDVLEDCCDFTVAASSLVNEHIQYVGTTHHMFSMDIRKPGHIIQRWTHLLHGPPQYLKVCCDIPGRELIFLGNTERSDLISLVNEWPDNDLNKYPVSRTQPYLVNTIYDSLNEAKVKGLCLDLDIQSRMKLALTGMCCISSSKPAVFTSTAAGDVYCQRISSRFASQSKEEEEDENLSFTARMTYWQEKAKEADLDRIVPPVHASRITDMSLFIQDLQNEEVNGEAAPCSTCPVEAEWLLPQNVLFESKDKIGSKILKIWDIKNYQDWLKLRNGAYELPMNNDVHLNHVEQWLAAHHDGVVTESQETELLLQTQTQVSDHISASQQVDLVKNPPSQAGSDLVILSQKFQRKSKKKRTDGF